MRILTAEDDRVMSKLLKSVLEKWGYEVFSVEDGLEAWRVLSAPMAPKLALLDWMLPGMDGVQICRSLRKKKLDDYAYVILLTGRTGANDLLAGLEAGADDYLKKPFDLDELRMRLRTGQRILELQERLLLAQEFLRLEATTDALTGAVIRREFLRQIESELVRSGRTGHPVSVALFDLDHFKAVNDRFGHLVGDSVLKEVVRLVQASLRPYDQIGRFGGDEFVLLLPQCDEEGAVGLGDRIRSLIQRTPLETPEGRLAVTVSMGLATSPPLSATPRGLLAAADSALYRSKEGGRNRVTLADARDAAKDECAETDSEAVSQSVHANVV
jgi:two-component system, cell cycle response regulator